MRMSGTGANGGGRDDHGTKWPCRERYPAGPWPRIWLLHIQNGYWG